MAETGDPAAYVSPGSGQEGVGQWEPLPRSHFHAAAKTGPDQGSFRPARIRGTRQGGALCLWRVTQLEVVS